MISISSSLTGTSAEGRSKEVGTMNKRELVDAVAAKTGFTRKKIDRAIDATLEAVSEAMKNGESVALLGFGTFNVTNRSARSGVNPRTREKIAVAARRVPGFRAGKALKEAVSSTQSAAFVYDGTTDGITTLCGQGVTVSGGQLRFTNPGEENRVVFGEPNLTDYVVHVTATLASGSGYGIYYRADGKPGFQPGITGYCFQFDPGLSQLLVRKVVDGYESEPFQSIAMPASVAATLNGAHDISVAVEGDHHLISVDGAVVLDFHDGTFSSGLAGLRGWNGCDPLFSAINIRLNP
jgi:DNA-binding protein HU-beta